MAKQNREKEEYAEERVMKLAMAQRAKDVGREAANSENPESNEPYPDEHKDYPQQEGKHLSI
uniref:Uncharacterized protein n=1 Tax=Oryza brachyantha TaxID=4533 RepID=J3MFM6_ORYBR